MTASELQAIRNRIGAASNELISFEIADSERSAFACLSLAEEHAKHGWLLILSSVNAAREKMAVVA